MARSSGLSICGNTPRSTTTKRQLSHQRNSIDKKVRLNSTPRHITPHNNNGISSPDTNTGPNNNSSPTTQQGNPNEHEAQENDINNPLPSNGNEPDEESKIQDTTPNTSMKEIKMSNNSNNNMNTDNTSDASIPSQHDEQEHPRSEEDADDNEESDPISSPTSKNNNRPENETDNWLDLFDDGNDNNKAKQSNKLTRQKNSRHCKSTTKNRVKQQQNKVTVQASKEVRQQHETFVAGRSKGLFPLEREVRDFIKKHQEKTIVPEVVVQECNQEP
eukprot:4043854-Ditylum_brightwellii.AAC.1